MQFGVISLLPEIIEPMLNVGVVGRAVKQQRISVEFAQPRDFTNDAHRTVDDRPFGGGPGMVMKPEPLVQCIASLKKNLPAAPVVYLSPQGKPLRQSTIRRWQGNGSLILLAGRYEGIDERVIDTHIDEEVSIGDYVLSGGEIAAMAVIDAISRLVPGVLGHPDSALEDSFGDHGLLDCPHYTRPEKFDEKSVPAVLLSGDHQAIAIWRRKLALKRTWERRPDLLANATLSDSDKQYLQQLEAAQQDNEPAGDR